MLFAFLYLLSAFSLGFSRIAAALALSQSGDRNGLHSALQQRAVTDPVDIIGYTDNTGEYQWMANVKIAGQTYRMIIDTGFSTTWVWSNQMDPDYTPIGQHTRYDLDTAPNIISGGAFSQSYQYPSTANLGIVVKDTLSIGSLSIDMEFGAAKTLAGDFFYSDGLLGLGWRAASQIIPPTPTFIELLAPQLQQKVFTTLAHMYKAGGKLSFGTIDPHYEPILHEPLAVNNSGGTWQVENLVFYVGGKAYAQVDTAFDFGAPVVELNTQIVTPYWAAIPGAYKLPNNETNWVVPCSTQLPDLTFTSPSNGNTKHIIPGQNLMGARDVEQPGDVCYGALVAEDPRCPVYGCALLGAPFFAAHYVVWNIGDPGMGKAPTLSFAPQDGMQIGTSA